MEELGGLLTGVNLTEGGNAGPVTLLLEGGPFIETNFELRGQDGELILATNVRVFEGGDKAAATFDLTGAPPGQYDVVAGWDDESIALLPDGFTIVPGGSGQFEVGLIGPHILRAGVQMPFTLQWSNTGNVDMPVELINLDLPTGLNINLGPDNKQGLDEVVVLSFAAGTTDYGVLPAGASGSMDLWLTSQPGFPDLDVQIGSIPIDDPSLASVPMNWDSLLTEIMPEGINADRLDGLINNITVSLGQTLGEVLDAFTDNAVMDFLGEALDTGEAALDRINEGIQAGQSALGNLLADAMTLGYPKPEPGAEADGVHQGFVLIIAIEDFSYYVGNSGSDLPGTQKDLEALLKFYHQELNIGGDQITVLRDRAGTAADDMTFAKIKAAWQALVAKADADDKIKVHFSGHGNKDFKDAANLGALIMNDPAGPDFIDVYEFKQMFEDDSMPGETYVVLDSCYSEFIASMLTTEEHGPFRAAVPRLKWESAVALDETAFDGKDSYTQKWVEAHRDKDSDRDGDRSRDHQ